MSNIARMMQRATAGAGSEALDVSQVFRAHFHSGNSGTQNIVNGIDLAGEGGLIWSKCTNVAHHNGLVDTERGVNKDIESSSASAEETRTGSNVHVTAFNSNGFSLGADQASAKFNYSGREYITWTFRKAKRFFDIQTWTGDGVNGRTISHNLGSVPGMIIVKRRDAVENFIVYHRGIDSSAPENYAMFLNSDAARSTETYWYNAAPTSTGFQVSNNVKMNGSSGQTYVAYIFAHNNGDGTFGPNQDQDIISCGTFTGTSGGTGLINLGWEPELVVYKRWDGTGDWFVVDQRRGFTSKPPNNGQSAHLYWNKTNTQASLQYQIGLDSEGFREDGLGAGNDFIYMAIRRGPLNQPEAGTEVFNASKFYGDGTTDNVINLGFPTDMIWGARLVGDPIAWVSRVRGEDKQLYSYGTAAEGTGTDYCQFDSNIGPRIGYNGAGVNINSGSYEYVLYGFRRQAGFFDTLCYRGNGSNRNITHSLNAVPEMIITKCRSSSSSSRDWAVYHKGLNSGTNPEQYAIRLNLSSGQFGGSDYWDNTAPTSSVFRVGNNARVNDSNQDYTAWLFGSVDGVCKIGNYSGTGSQQTINCGFSSSARFILIKQQTTGDWFLFSTAHGLVSGGDSYLQLNATGGESTGVDLVDPNSSGFAVTSSSNVNSSGVNYIFMAIA